MTAATRIKSLRPQNLAGLVVAAGVLVVISVAGFLFAGRGAATGGGDGAARVLQQMALGAAAAAAGDAAAIDALERGAGELATLQRSAGAASWARDPRTQRLLDDAAIIAGSKAALIDTGRAVAEVRDAVPRLIGELGQAITPASGVTPDSLARVFERFDARAQRLQNDLVALASGGATAAQSAKRLAEGVDYLGQVINGFAGSDASLGLPRIGGGDAGARLAGAQRTQVKLAETVRRAVAAAPKLPEAMRATRDVAANAAALAPLAPGASAPGGAPWWPIVPALLALLPLAYVFRTVAALRKDSEQQRLAAAYQRKEADRNQEAILRLLDEISSLADGDLTAQATVTEDITGAIADSINYAVEALRGLVTTINQSAIQLDGTAKQTAALAQHLAKASNAQSKQIASATESIGDMAAFTEEISGNAERSSDVARHSVDVAHKGGEAVRRTIDGMNTIRETIQETSKRIKRLGESSQEIGNIVELINDIAEQTNILALNASIQASMAGEAGRGFAVVADEVQRLAERAANATKQIEVLVRTIQADTNEAVVSMERSTTDVVGGALLAENAGAALEEIEQVSNQIASLVQNISSGSRQQAGAASNIVRNMQVLKEISLQTADSTSATSHSVAKLAELSAGLRTAAAGFRLPETAAPRRSDAAPRAPAAAPKAKISKASGFGGGAG